MGTNAVTVACCVLLVLILNCVPLTPGLSVSLRPGDDSVHRTLHTPATHPETELDKPYRNGLDYVYEKFTFVEDAERLAAPRSAFAAKLSVGGLLQKALMDVLEKQVQQSVDTLLKSNISEKCGDDILTTMMAFSNQAQWPLQMFDSSGKPETGLLYGNVYWFGSYDECLQIQPVLNTTHPEPLFGTKYFLASVPVKALKLSIQWGVCMPNSCSGADISTLITEALSMIGVNASITAEVREETFPVSTGAIVMLVVFGVLVLLIFMATAYDVLIYQRIIQQLDTEPIIEPNVDTKASVSSSGSGMSTPVEVPNAVLKADEYTPLLNKPAVKVITSVEDLDMLPRLVMSMSLYSNMQKLLATGRTSNATLGSVHGIRFISMTWVILGHSFFFGLRQVHLLPRLVMSMSLYSNMQKLLATGHTSNATLGSVHGIRFISMTWVILGHSFSFGLRQVRNILQFPNFLKDVNFQVIINATVSVDTFFLLSGLLVAYLTLREMKARDGPRGINWVLFYFHRFWRLTPAYMLILAAYTTMFRNFGNGPAWPGDVPEPYCRENWWTNLLYINNIVDSQKGCMMWTWYLANDMQFYVLSPLILIPLYLHFGLGLAVILVFMLTSFVATGVISVENNYPPSTAAALYYLPTFFDFFKNLYVVPWTRIGPYLIGILVGYFLYRTNRKINMHWAVVTAAWLVAAACNLTILYGLYDQANGTLASASVNALYNSVHRTIWAAGVGWVIFACVTGYGGPVNQLLSWPAFIPLSRLTYLAYLVHPIIMQWFYFSRRTTIYLDITSMVFYYFGYLVSAYGVAFVLSLALEAPLIGLEKVIFKRT